MKTIFLITHIVVSVFLMSLILLQTSKGGLGSAFGEIGFYRTKRGAEKMIFGATIISACLFLITSVINLLLR